MMERSYPQRTCIGCRQVKDKKSLIRIVLTPEGELRVDAGGKANGRGAYVCPDPVCIETAFRKGQLAKSLRTAVSSEAKERIKEELKKIEEENT